MGFDEGRIVLDSDNGAYYAGQTVFGRIIFDQGKPKTIHGIYVSCKGFCKVHWTTTKTRRVNKQNHTVTVHHESYEDYFKRKTFVIGDSSGEQQIEAGHHEYHFNCPIPNNCPSSFEGSYGHIRYRVKAVMVTSGIFSSNKEKMVALRVHAPVDLNENPYCKEPMEYELNNSYCCWCVSAGSSEVQVKLPVGGYCPGQIIPLEVSAVNSSTIEIDEIKFSIKQNIKFEATTNPATRYDHDTVVTIKKGPIPARTTRNWQLEMEVPALDVYNLNGCRYIDIDHYFKVSVEASGCHEDSEESHPIIIGTIPLVGFQDTVQNPLHDQLPKPVVQNAQGVNAYPPPPIINQPLPYSPYPNTNYPHEKQNLQCTPSASPYSTKRDEFYGLAPFPAVPMLHPSPGPGPHKTVSPYPTNDAVPPYPTSAPVPPYSTNAPVPPYPTSAPVPPYPASAPVPPYPTSAPVPPYPTSNPVSPYPTNQSVVSSSIILKTGTIGFAVGSDGNSKLPSLPPGASVPYPPSPATNPYGSASAPVPSTPTSEDTTSDVNISPSPAYNPTFVDQKNNEKPT